MATAAVDAARRDQAWLDFCNLEAQGIKPNANALYNYYIEKNREHPELRAQIPTTNRSTIYEWCKEDRWNERYAEKVKAKTEADLAKYDSIRGTTYGRLVQLQDIALAALADLAENATDQKVRLQAAESIFDRTGLGKVAAKPQAANADSKPEFEEAPMLPEDATEEEAMKWMQQYGGNSYNA